jgi:hypothetical protein
MSVNISNATKGEIAYAAFNSISATANIAVTEWRNTKGYNNCLARAVKFVVIELAYAGIAVLGTLEFLARSVACVVTIPLYLISLCIPCKMIKKGAGHLLTATFRGSAISAGTAFDAALNLLGNICNKGKIPLNFTKQCDPKGLFSKMLAGSGYHTIL